MVHPGNGDGPMNPLYLLGGGIAIALLVYLFVALFKPESFS